MRGANVNGIVFNFKFYLFVAGIQGSGGLLHMSCVSCNLAIIDVCSSASPLFKPCPATPNAWGTLSVALDL